MQYTLFPVKLFLLLPNCYFCRNRYHTRPFQGACRQIRPTASHFVDINRWLAIWRTHWKRYQPFAKPISIQENTNKDKKTSMLRAGFQPTTPVSERQKSTHFRSRGFISYRNFWCFKFQISYSKNSTEFENLMEFCNMLTLLRPGSINPSSFPETTKCLLAFGQIYTAMKDILYVAILLVIFYFIGICETYSWKKFWIIDQILSLWEPLPKTMSR